MSLSFHQYNLWDSNVCIIIGDFVAVRACTEEQVKQGLWRPKRWARWDIYEEVLRVCFEHCIYPHMAQYAFERIHPYSLYILATQWQHSRWTIEAIHRGVHHMVPLRLWSRREGFIQQLLRQKHFTDHMAKYDTGYRRRHVGPVPEWCFSHAIFRRKRPRLD